MPMGLKNASSTFQRLIELVFNGMYWTKVCLYIDDIVIFGKNFEDKLNNLKEVFDRLRHAGLKAKPSKCRFFCKEVTFLGHKVSSEGVLPDTSNIDKVMNWPRPQNVTGVRGFIGLTGFYRRYIHKYAKITQPLVDLTRKDVSFIGSDECESAFIVLKNALVQPPILAYPSYEKPFILCVDALWSCHT